MRVCAGHERVPGSKFTAVSPEFLHQTDAVADRDQDHFHARATGHFQLPQFSATILNPAHPEVGNGAISVWMLDHPDIYQAAALGVTVEHLGATMWSNDPVTGQYVASGGSEWGTTYTMPREVISLGNAEQDAYLAAVAAVNASGWPDYPVATVRPGTVPVYLGEGSSLYAAGLGTVSLCPLPAYLLQAGDARQPQLLDLDKLDQRLMYGQILALARSIATLDALPASALWAEAPGGWPSCTRCRPVAARPTASGSYRRRPWKSTAVASWCSRRVGLRPRGSETASRSGSYFWSRTRRLAAS